MKCDEIKLFKLHKQLFVKFYNPIQNKFEKMKVCSDQAVENEFIDNDYFAYITEIKKDEHAVIINFEQFNEILSIPNQALRDYYINFIIFHEIGHYLLAHTRIDTDHSPEDEQWLEEQADLYALETIRTNRRLRRLIARSEEKYGYLFAPEEPELEDPEDEI